MAVDLLPLRNVYPTLGTRTLGDIATGAEVGPPPEQVVSGGEARIQQALAIGERLSPIVGFGLFLALALLVAWAASRVATDTERVGLIRASAVNALVVSGFAIAGIPLWKWVFTRLPVPGVSTWVLSV